jgi:hypothetical protein
MSEDFGRVTYAAEWVGAGLPVALPEVTVRAMARDDHQAEAERAELEASAADAREAVALAASRSGRDLSLDGALDRCKAGFRALDYRDEKLARAAGIADGSVVELDEHGRTIVPAERSGRAYEDSRQVEQAEENHRWMVGYKARRSGTTFAQAMASRGQDEYEYARRFGPEISRGGGYVTEVR